MTFVRTEDRAGAPPRSAGVLEVRLKGDEPLRNVPGSATRPGAYRARAGSAGGRHLAPAPPPRGRGVLTEAQIPALRAAAPAPRPGREGTGGAGSGPGSSRARWILAGAAAAYLRAGGTEVERGSTSAGAWASDAATPRRTGPRGASTSSAAPAAPERSGVVVGVAAEAPTLLWSHRRRSRPASTTAGASHRALAPPEIQARRDPARHVARASSSSAARSASHRARRVSDVRAKGCSPRCRCAVRPSAPRRSRTRCLTALLRHLAAALPDEGMRVLVGARGPGPPRPHAERPGRTPRSRPQAFRRTRSDRLQPRAACLAHVLRQADQAGERVLAIAHSHPEGRVRASSAEDRRLGGSRWTAPSCPAWRTSSSAFGGGRPRSACWAVWAGVTSGYRTARSRLRV
jgi:proteasome lid subunit RPN8/RPN11